MVFLFYNRKLMSVVSKGQYTLTQLKNLICVAVHKYIL